MISPAQIDTCTEELLRDSVAAARERNLPFTVHCGQAVAEFYEMVRRHGITPIQWAHQIGLGGPGTLLVTRSLSTSIRGCTGDRGRMSRSWRTRAPRWHTARLRSPGTATC